MRIAIAGQTYYPGNNGQAIFTIHLAEGLVQAGHEVHMLVPWRQAYAATEVINGVQVHKMRSLDFGWIHPEAWFPFFSAGEVRRLFKAHRPDMLHLQDHYFLCRDAVRVAQQMKIPVMGTNHFLPENLLPYLQSLPLPRRFKIAVLWRLMLTTYNRLNLVTTPTETAARILRQQAIHVPVSPVSCGVNTDHFHPCPDQDRAAACAFFGLDPERVLILYVGRLDREKRIDVLLRAVAHLRDQGRGDIQLAVAGQGAAAGELRGLAHTLNLDRQVQFLGYIADTDLPRLYRTGDIFAMPSPEELQSIATLEAMASGLPVLAANARALPELVADGVNGCLFAAGQVESAAAGMASLIDHRADWPAMGRAGRARAETHSLMNTICKYEALYRQICG